MRSLRGLFIPLAFLCLLSGASVAAFAEPVDINTADAQTLAVVLKGVGPDKAKAIVAYRQEHGSFKSVDDLKLVKGIGDKTVMINRDKITATDPARAEEEK